MNNLTLELLHSTKKTSAFDKGILFYLYQVLFLFLYRITLEVLYLKFIVVYFGYMGFYSRSNISIYTFSWLSFLFSIPVIVYIINKQSISDIIICVLFLISYIPNTVVIGYMVDSFLFVIAYFVYWIFLSIAIFLLPRYSFHLTKYYFGKYLFMAFFAVFPITVLFVSWRYTGFNINLNLLDVYNLRLESRNRNYPVVAEYMFSAARTIIPTLVVFLLGKKKYVFVLPLVFVIFLQFSVDGTKSVIFSLFFSIFGYFLYKQSRIKLIPIALFFINSLAIAEFFLLKHYYIASVFCRRAFFLPSLLNVYYFDFFSVKELVLFRYGPLRRLGFELPYSYPPENLIGGLYFDNYQMSANNGLFADAYANLGFFGLFFMPFFVVLMLRFMEGCATRIEVKYLIAVVVIFSYSLNNSSIFTVLFTHGFIATCFLLYFFPRDDGFLFGNRLSKEEKQ